eukprot:gene807-2543_t
MAFMLNLFAASVSDLKSIPLAEEAHRYYVWPAIKRFVLCDLGPCPPPAVYYRSLILDAFHTTPGKSRSVGTWLATPMSLSLSATSTTYIAVFTLEHFTLHALSVTGTVVPAQPAHPRCWSIRATPGLRRDNRPPGTLPFPACDTWGLGLLLLPPCGRVCGPDTPEDLSSQPPPPWSPELRSMIASLPCGSLSPFSSLSAAFSAAFSSQPQRSSEI